VNFRRHLRVESPGFQLAPMIDVVFLLLCFFVTSQLFAQWEAEIDVALPTARTGRVPHRLPGEVILNILRDGRVVVSGQSLDETGLSGLLRRLVAVFPGQAVVLRADRATAYEHVIRVLDQCRQADLWNISFATALPESPAP
jgi:biopolymer transport protein ExbD